MLINAVKKISIIVMMLIFFVLPGFALPLTRTFYTPRENILDVSLYRELINTGDLYSKEALSLGMGLYKGAGADVKVEVLHDSALQVKDKTPGDSFAGFYFPLVNAAEGRLRFFYFTRFRIPTGPDPAEDEKWANISFGRDELLTGPGVSFKANEVNLLTLNFFYIFREAEEENLYAPLNFNPTGKKTWKTFFGFNPFSEESLFNSDHLENDYCSMAVSLINTYYFPFVLFGEVYHSRAVSSGGGDGLAVEGDRVNPVFVSGGVKYIFSSNFFIQGACTVSLVREKGFLKECWSVGVNIFF